MLHTVSQSLFLDFGLFLLNINPYPLSPIPHRPSLGLGPSFQKSQQHQFLGKDNYLMKKMKVLYLLECIPINIHLSAFQNAADFANIILFNSGK